MDNHQSVPFVEPSIENIAPRRNCCGNSEHSESIPRVDTVCTNPNNLDEKPIGNNTNNMPVIDDFPSSDIEKYDGSEGIYEEKEHDDDFGLVEDFESPSVPNESDRMSSSQAFQTFPLLHKSLTLPTPMSQPPLYILESSLETQKLWYSTAGRRPQQPPREREYYENLWSQNFANSEVDYPEPLNDRMNTTLICNATVPSNEKRKRSRAQTIVDDDSSSKKDPKKKQDVIPTSELRGEIVFRGKSTFSNAVSKSFQNNSMLSMTLYMPYYRIIKAPNGNMHAEFMIIVSFGGNNPVTFGVWKRHSDFAQLAYELSDTNINSGTKNMFKNSLLSWHCVLQRKRWFKSLDHEYLTLKCFLLERFIHDVLFETESPDILVSFLGLD